MPRSRHAFTLIELALVLVILSLMTGFGLQAFQTNRSIDCYAETETKLKIIERSLQSFIAANSRLPKPASRKKGSNNSTFGTEETGGVSSSAAAYATTLPTELDASGSVVNGMVPVATLGLPLNFASDCWGGKISYSVTNALTSSNTTNGYPSNAAGNITVVDANLSNITTTAGYVIVSHGPDGYGALPVNANDVAGYGYCSTSGTRLDRYNCDGLQHYFLAAIRNTSQAAADTSYFDDVILYSAKSGFLNDCASQVVTWNTNCSGTMPVLSHGGTLTLTNSAPGYNGTTNLSCSNGVVSSTPVSCTAGSPPAASPLCWDRNSSECDMYYSGTCSNARWCGVYYYTNGTSVTDTAPCDATAGAPPAGWSNC